MTLDRWCGVVAAAYPEGARRAEVRATLADASDGRRVPRLGDALNILGHGLVARVGSTAPGTRFGRWGDAASVALVLGLLMQAVTAAAVVARAYAPPRPAEYPMWLSTYTTVVFRDWREAAVATVAALLAVAAFVAVARGRVRAARLLTVAAAAGGAGVYAAERMLDEYLTYTSLAGRCAVAAGVAVALGVLLSGAVARASRAVPAWWWAPAALACTLAAVSAVVVGPHPFGMGRAAVVLTAFAYEAAVLFAVALPLARRAPVVLGGAALVLVPTTPLVVVGLEVWLTVAPRWVSLGLVVLLAGAFALGVTRLALRAAD